jgi:hypothetical protein
MPYALKLAGFYSGMALIAIVAMCSDYSLRLLVTLARKTKSKYYEDLVSSQFGHSGYLFVVGAMGIFAYGAMVAYLIGIGAAHRATPACEVDACSSAPPPPLRCPQPAPGAAQATTCPSSSQTRAALTCRRTRG